MSRTSHCPASRAGRGVLGDEEPRASPQTSVVGTEEPLVLGSPPDQLHCS